MFITDTALPALHTAMFIEQLTMGRRSPDLGRLEDSFFSR